MVWLTGWLRRKNHVITASAGAGTNYQTCIKVYKTTGTDGTETINGITAGKVYVGSNCRDDFGDIRFTDDDGSTELDYWQDSRLLVSGTSSVFWVEVKDTLESNATIYVYYNNAAQTTTSNGANTFLLFDDFDDNSFDATKWTDDDRGGGVLSEPSGTALLLDVHPNVSADNSGVRSIATFTSGVAFLVRRKQAADHGYYIQMSLVAGTTCDENGLTAGWWNTTGHSGYHCRHYGKGAASSEIYEMAATGAGVALTTADVNGGDCSVYAIWEMRYDKSGVLTWLINGASRASATDTTFQASAKNFQVGQGSYNGGAYGSDTSVDYIIGRKFIATEPAHSTWGDEEMNVTLFITRKGTPQSWVWDTAIFGADKVPIGSKTAWIWDYPEVTGTDLAIHGIDYTTTSQLPKCNWKWDTEKRRQDYFYNYALDNSAPEWIAVELNGGAVTRNSSSFTSHPNESAGNWAWSAYLQGHKADYSIEKRLSDVSVSEIAHLYMTIRWRRTMAAIKNGGTGNEAKCYVMAEFWCFNPDHEETTDYPMLEVSVIISPWLSEIGSSAFVITNIYGYSDHSTTHKQGYSSIHLSDPGLNNWADETFDFLPYIVAALAHWSMSSSAYHVCRLDVGAESHYGEYSAEIDTIRCEVD